MSFTILNVAYPLASVSPNAVGGAEQVVSRCDRAVARAGGPGMPGSARRHANIMVDRRGLGRLGPVEIEATTAESARRLRPKPRRWHAARWQGRGPTRVLARHKVWEFHRKAVRGLLDRGTARLYIPRVNGTPAGACCGFPPRHRADYYLGRFDPALRQYGIGNPLLRPAMAAARHEGAAVFDFLRGQETCPHRRGAQDEPMFCRRVRPAPTSTLSETFDSRVRTLRSTAQPVASRTETVDVPH